MRGLFRSPTVPPGLSVLECGAGGSASGRTACPIRSTLHYISESGHVARVLCTLAARLRPSKGLDECFFFISLVFGLPCSSIFCQSWLVFLFLNCCCPSFGCARRHSVSTYTSILAGSSQFCSDLDCFLPSTCSGLCFLLFLQFLLG